MYSLRVFRIVFSLSRHAVTFFPRKHVPDTCYTPLISTFLRDVLAGFANDLSNCFLELSLVDQNYTLARLINRIILRVPVRSAVQQNSLTIHKSIAFFLISNKNRSKYYVL